jgi:hypothetical protein
MMHESITWFLDPNGSAGIDNYSGRQVKCLL